MEFGRLDVGEVVSRCVGMEEAAVGEAQMVEPLWGGLARVSPAA
jgi:hypothetical protein